MLKWASTEHLATVSARRPKKTIVIWLVALIVAFGGRGDVRRRNDDHRVLLLR